MVSCKLFGASVASAVWSIKKSKTLRVKAMACKTLELSSKVEKFTCTFFFWELGSLEILNFIKPQNFSW